MKNEICPNCGGKKDYRAIRCSRCRYKLYWSKGNNPFYKHGKSKCVDCGKILSNYESYKRCWQCWLKYNRGENHHNYKEDKKKNFCIDCGKPIQIHNKRCRKCNGVYFGKNQKGKNNHSYINGKWKELYPSRFNRQLKDKVRVRDNFICQLCNIPELELNRKLCVHHIDYDKDGVDIDKMISLCLSCHNKTNYNREYWRQYFDKIGKVEETRRVNIS